MKKINLKKPKYILPLVLLPFLIFGNYIYAKYGSDDGGPVAVATNGINPNIPEPILKKNHDMDKTEAFKENLQKKREFSFLNDIGEEEIQKITIEDNLSDAERRKLDSLQKVIKRDEERAKKAKDLLNDKRFNKPTSGQVAKKKTSPPRTYGKKNSTKRSKNSKKKEELAEFKEQMRIIDSIQNPSKYAIVDKALVEKKEEKPIAKLSKSKNSNNDFFNTIKSNRDESFIGALLDEGVKVWQGSRVRIRLTQDVFINDVLLKKGKYLYGTVTGFKTQRVEITISSIAVGDEVIPVDITIYDNDGIKGLYVPDSQFREFVKDLGVNASRDASILTNGGGTAGQQGTEALYRSISTAVQSSTRALAKALKKNKARLKYNTQVFLINTENE